MRRTILLTCLLLASCRSADRARSTGVPSTAPTVSTPAALTVSTPGTISEALDLWRRRGPQAVAAVTAIADYYASAELTRSPQEHFDLLREMSAAVPPGRPAAPGVVRTIAGYLRLESPDGIGLSGEVLPPPWHVIMRLVVGTRVRAEMAPTLTRAIRDELARLDAPTPDVDGPPPAFSPRLRNSLYALGYLRLRDAAGLVGRCARRARGEDRILALNAIAQTGDRASGDVVLETLATSTETGQVAAAAHAALELLGEDAEPHLVALSRRAGARIRATAVLPLLRLCTPAALSALASLRSRSDDDLAARLIDAQLRRHATALAISVDDLHRMIESSPELAAETMFANARRLTFLSPGERRLSHEELAQVLAHWRERGTIYTGDWSWVRDRHIVDAARSDDIRALEDVRVSVLREYRTTCVNEAEILQRMISAVERRTGRGAAR